MAQELPHGRLLSCKCMHLAQKDQERECPCNQKDSWGILEKSHWGPCPMEWVSERMKKEHTKSLPEWVVKWQDEESVTSLDPPSCQEGQCSEESTWGAGQCLSIVVSRERVIGVSRWLKIKEGGGIQCSNVWKVLHSIDLKMQAQSLTSLTPVHF